MPFSNRKERMLLAITKAVDGHSYFVKTSYKSAAVNSSSDKTVSGSRARNFPAYILWPLIVGPLYPRLTRLSRYLPCKPVKREGHSDFDLRKHGVNSLFSSISSIRLITVRAFLNCDGL